MQSGAEWKTIWWKDWKRLKERSFAECRSKVIAARCIIWGCCWVRQDMTWQTKSHEILGRMNSDLMNSTSRLSFKDVWQIYWLPMRKMLYSRLMLHHVHHLIERTGKKGSLKRTQHRSFVRVYVQIEGRCVNNGFIVPRDLPLIRKLLSALIVWRGLLTSPSGFTMMMMTTRIRLASLCLQSNFRACINYANLINSPQHNF